MQRLKRLSQDRFIKNNIIFFVGSLAAAFLNYLYHPILGRLLPIEAFGEVQAFISFSLLFAVFTGLFRNVIVNIVANYRGNEADKNTILYLQKLGLYLALAVSAVLLFGSHYFARQFNFDSPYFFLALAATIFIGVLTSTHQAVLQGLHDFKALSVAGIVGAASKVLLAVLLVYLGFNVAGAVGSLVLSGLAALAYSYYRSQRAFPLSNGHKVRVGQRVRSELWYACLIFAATMAVTFLYTADTLIMKRFFPADVAGYYSGIAAIGRIIFFLTGSIAGVLLPSISSQDLAGQNRPTLIKAIGLTVLLGGGALLTFGLFPGTVISLMIGQRYAGWAHLLPKVSLFLFIVSLANLLFFYFLALRRNFILVAAIAGPASVLLLSFWRHGTVEQVINNFLIGSAVVLLLLVGKLIGEFSPSKK